MGQTKLLRRVKLPNIEVCRYATSFRPELAGAIVDLDKDVYSQVNKPSPKTETTKFRNLISAATRLANQLSEAESQLLELESQLTRTRWATVAKENVKLFKAVGFSRIVEQKLLCLTTDDLQVKIQQKKDEIHNFRELHDATMERIEHTNLLINAMLSNSTQFEI